MSVGTPRNMAGIAYIEILVATLLIMVALVPALDALKPGIAGAALQENRLADHYSLTGRLEEMLTQPFTEIDTAATEAGDRFTPSIYSDVVSYPDGRQITRNVYLSRYDSDNADADNDPFTGMDADLLWVRVEIAETLDGLESLLSE